jgi:urease accessory protein UreF
MAAHAGMQLARGLGGSSRLLQQSAARRLGGARRTHHQVVAALSEETRARIQERLPVTVAGLSLGSASLPAAAHAQDGATVDQAVGSIVDLVKATGEAVKTGVSAAQTGAEYARAAYEQVAPVVKSAVETAAPVVKEGVKATVETVTPALQTGLKEAEKVLSASGVDTSAAKPLVDTTTEVVTTAKPFAEQAITFLTTTEPALLGQYALALIAAYYLTPPLLKAGVGFLRGYAGDIAPAAALSAVESEVSSKLQQLGY